MLVLVVYFFGSRLELFRGDNMKSYVIRDIPPELWREVKMLAAGKEIPVRTLILNLLKQALEEDNGN